MTTIEPLRRKHRNDLIATCQGLIDAVQDLCDDAAAQEDHSPIDLIRQARLLRLSTIDVVTMAVITSLEEGRLWPQVAEALGLEERFVREHYEPILQHWLDGNYRPDVVLPHPPLDMAP